jgi:hypothetical protein
LIDLPRLADGKAVDPGETGEFGKELLRFISALGLDAKIIHSLGKFDFSGTSHFGFVHSMSVFTRSNPGYPNTWTVAVLTPVQTGN